MDLSINCNKCGATNKFDENHIPTFCSFCGASLPDMKPYVQDAIKLSLERKRHEMHMETADKEIKKEKIRSFRDILDSSVDLFGLGIALLLIILLILSRP